MTLVEQQHAVIQASIPVSVGMISGSLEPDQWRDAQLWQRVLSTHQIIVSTPQVLLDALRNGYIHMARDISLLVFDEAHHAVKGHPYNLIMSENYKVLYDRSSSSPPKGASVISPGVTVDLVRPMVLGLTASPIFGSDIYQAFK